MEKSMQLGAACAGVYLGGLTRHVVALDGDGRITLSPAGQPTYHLVPYRAESSGLAS
jgi:hypothetical protein